MNVKTIERLKSRPGRYPDGDGLHLDVTDAGTASWTLRYQINHRERWHGLGPLRLIGLQEARKRARRAQLKILDGLDPIVERKKAKELRAVEAAKARETVTFEDATRGYFAKASVEWQGRKTAHDFTSRMERLVWPTIGKVPVEKIDKALVLKVLEPIWRGPTSTAERVRSNIKAVIDWAIARDLRSGPNPAEWKGNLGGAIA